MLSCEGFGKTIEKAIEDALLNLKAPREDVDIKILEEGGLFKKAKVLVSISEDCLEKYEKKQKPVITEKPAEKQPTVEKTPVIETEKMTESKIETKKIEKPEEKTPEKTPEKTTRKPKQTKVCVEGKVGPEEFLKGLLSVLEIDGEIAIREDNEKTTFEITGDSVSDVIGYRGECLNAIQFLTNVIASRHNPDCERIVLDAENYRQKREETLKALAQRMARKVAKTRHSVKLEPMNANERRIIHLALQEDEYVETVSKGSEPNRFLVITPKK